MQLGFFKHSAYSEKTLQRWSEGYHFMLCCKHVVIFHTWFRMMYYKTVWRDFWNWSGLTGFSLLTHFIKNDRQDFSSIFPPVLKELRGTRSDQIHLHMLSCLQLRRKAGGCHRCCRLERVLTVVKWWYGILLGSCSLLYMSVLKEALGQK